jgi:sugar lactone lactonase YvrE
MESDEESGMRILLAMALFATACATDAVELTDNDGFDDTSLDGKADESQASRHVVHTFSDKRLYPEGGAFDAADGAFYVGSLQHGNITRVGADGRESIFYAGTGEAKRFTLGMQVDTERRRLWVCTTKDSLGTVWIFDLASGARLDSIDLTAVNPEAACNDVLLDGDTAYVSDRENTHIYRIDETRHVSMWAHDPLLGGAVVSLNSLVFTPDHSAILTAVYLQPTLVRVSVANPHDVREVDLSGDLFMDGFNVLNGPDDLMMMDNGQLIVAFGSTIKRVTPRDSSWAAASVKSTRTIGGVTALVRGNGKLFGINGQSVRFALGVPPNGFEIFEIEPSRLR